MKRRLQLMGLIFCMLNVSQGLAQTNFDWAKNFGSSSGEVPDCIASDASSNVYSTGYFQGSADLDPSAGFYAANSAGAYDFYVSKLDASGNFIWGRSIGSTGNDIGHAIAVDANNNVYVAGYFTGTVDFDPGAGTFTMTSLGSQDMFILKLDASGNFLWAKQLGSPSSDELYALALDNSGNVYTTGYFYDIVDFDPGVGTYTLQSMGNGDLFVSKLDANGNFIYAKQMGGTNHEVAYAITVDAAQNVYTTGYFFMNADFDPGPATFNISIPSSGCFISKLDVNGDFSWAKAFSGSSSVGRSIKADNANNVYTTGYFSGNVDFDPGAATYTMLTAGQTDIFVSKLDLAGNFIWANQLGGTGYDYCYSLALDASQNIYTTGYFNSVADFDPGAGTYTLASAGAEDVFISKLNSAGTFVSAYSLGGINYDQGCAITVDVAYNIYSTGYYTGSPSPDLDPTAGTYTTLCAGSGDIYILKLSQCVAPAAPANTTPTVNLLICQGNTTTLTAAGSGTLSWYASATSTTALGSGTSFVTPTLTAGTYTYYVESETCTQSASRTAAEFTVSACTGIQQLSQQNAFSIYPNPAESQLNLVFSSVEIGRIVLIYDSIGQTVRAYTTSEKNFSIAVGDLTAGIYFIEVRSQEQSIIKKMIKN
jgi:hypothetical protein